MLQKTYYPLTSPQMSIWYTEKMFPGTSISNVAGTLRIQENVDFNLLEKAIQLFIKNNDGIRLRMSLDENGSPQQYVSEYVENPIPFIDFTVHQDSAKAFYEWNHEMTLKPFELLDQDLYSFTMVKISDSDGGIYIITHHLVSDAWNMSLSGSFIVDYYCKLKNNITEASAYLPKPSYLSFIENDMAYHHSNRYEKDKIFWEQKFDTIPDATVLKTRKTNLITAKSKRKAFVAPEKFTSKLKEYCLRYKVTPYPLFLSALCMYIYRVAAKEDIVLGTPILNRLNHSDKNTSGMFISTIPLRINLNAEESFYTLSERVREVCSSAYRHQRFPYEQILRYARDKHGIKENLYDIVLSYQNTKFDKSYEVDYITRWHFNGYQPNSLTVHINDRDDEGTIIIDYDYHEDLYYDTEIDFLHQHLLNLLWHALDNPKNMICKIEMLPESEKRKILYEFNDTEMDYPKEKLIHQLFEEQVEKTPDNVAIVFEGKTMTYRELNEKANQLATLLRDMNLGVLDVVGLMVPRSFEMIIGMLAIFKSGAVYLPIDPDYPDNRIKYVLENSKAKILLTVDNEINVSFTIRTINISDATIYQGNCRNLHYINTHNDVAYILYTSGSTGEPKGAAIEHGALINCVYGIFKVINYNRIKKIMSSTSFSFDVFFIEIITGLFRGSSIYLLSDLERKSPDLMASIIRRNHIDLVVSTPSQITAFITNNEFYSSLKKIYALVLAGENVPETLLERLQKEQILVYNGYGPTETTVIVTMKDLSNSKKILIGKPMINTKVFIFDKNLLPVPIGTPGEIYIGGRGLAKGYIYNNRLTESKFIQNPYHASEKIYKTGDLGRWYPNGDIEFLGRTDQQVKIRGFRIELGEIQRKLSQIEGISNSYVTVIEHEESKKLCAYYLATKNFSAKSLRSRLMKEIPSFMVPSYFIRVDKIPVTHNGKVNVGLLPTPVQRKRKSNKRNLPSNIIEKEITEIWEKVLKQKNLEVTDEFSSVGGDSLSVIQIISNISKKYNVDIPIGSMEYTSTIRNMSKYVTGKMNEKKSSCHLSDSAVKIRDGQNDNIFLVHAGNGEVICYKELSETLNSRFNIWGIKVNDGNLALNGNIHLLAKEYADLILQIQPEGQYYLGGWCIGGSISFEIARILEQQQKKVALIGLINSIAPQSWKNSSIFSEEDERKFLYRNLINHIDNYSSNDIGLLWDKLFELLRSGRIKTDEFLLHVPEFIKIILPSSCYMDPEELVRYIRRIVILHKLRADYYPENKTKAKVVFFHATEDIHTDEPEENIEKWNQYCSHQIEKQSVKGNHYTMLTEPNVGLLGYKMNHILMSLENED